jgi:hypothetical protein
MAVAVACGGPVPTPSPGDSGSVRNALVRNGVTLVTAVSGETACDDAGLAGNSLRLRLTVPGDPEPRDAYLHVFRPRDFERSAAAIDACAAAYAGEVGAATVERLDVAPYRVIGSSWSPALREAIEAALREAAAGA